MRKCIHIVSLLLLLSPIIVRAQVRPAYVFVGAGTFDPGAGTRLYKSSGNGINADAALLFPFSKKLVPLNYSRFGALNIRLLYQCADEETPRSVRQGYRYNNGGTEPAIVTLDKVTYGGNRGFHFLVGPSMVFTHRRFFFSPSVQLGFSFVELQGLHYFDTIRSVSDPSLDQKVLFYYKPQRNNRQFSANGSVQMGMAVTNNVLVTLSAQYLFGPRLSFWDVGFHPGGQTPASGVYEFNQMVNGGYWTSDGEERWKGAAFQLNVGFRLGRKDPGGVRRVAFLPPIQRSPFYLVPPDQKLDIDLGESAKDKAAGEHTYKQGSLETLSADTNVIIVKPHFISATATDEYVVGAMQQDSVFVRFQLFSLSNGKMLAIPFPGYHPRRSTASHSNCSDSCIGESGTCVSSGTLRFCNSIVRSGPIPSSENIISVNALYSSNTEFLQITYYTSVYGKKVKVVINGRVDSECQTCWLPK